MIWKHAHQEAMFAAAEAHDDRGIGPTTRIDVFAAIDVELDLFFKPIGAAGFYTGRAVVVTGRSPPASGRVSGGRSWRMGSLRS